ncbi:MAG: carbohydrate ABC transporter permease [Oscillospiraceae bacterium]|nr:carbohydrate ABC transporter permease [Oscillospiraceae bacterium]
MNNLNYTQLQKVSTVIKYIILILVGFIMVYPLIWMVGATFKTNNEIFSNLTPFTANPTLDGYKNAMNDYGGSINIFKAMFNTYSYVLPKVLFTIISVTLTGYGFGRFNFIGRNVMFAALMATLFLPQVVMNVPQFILYNNLGWVDSEIYAPLIIPSLFAFDTTFVFMLIQFLRGIPREMDEAATIDGCNAMQTLVMIICPMLKPAIVSVALFQFMWSSNDYMGPLLYVKTPENYPAAIFVRLSMDADTGFEWNRVLAVSLISIIPSLVVFFCAQKQFIEGVSAGSVKG